MDTITLIISSGIVAAITSSVMTHFSNKKLEDYKFSQIQRQRASLIATLFSKWIKYRGKENEFLNGNKEALISYYEELNKMSIEISLWIKDEKLLNEIMSLLSLKENAPDIRTLTGKVRKIILDMDKDNFDSQNIIIWPKKEITLKLFGVAEKE